MTLREWNQATLVVDANEHAPHQTVSMMDFGKAGFALPPDELRAYKRDIGGDPFPCRFNTDYQIAQFGVKDLCGPEFVSPSWQNTQIPKTVVPPWVQQATGHTGQPTFATAPVEVGPPHTSSCPILDELIDDKPRPVKSSCPILDELIDGDDTYVFDDGGPSFAETTKKSSEFSAVN